MAKKELTIEELPIYSYVQCKVSNDAGIYQVIAIDGMNLKVMLDGARKGTWYTLDKIKPIKLNENWLQKLGFERMLMDEENPNNGYFYELWVLEDAISLCSGDKNGKLEVCVTPYEDDYRYQYVHEVQAAYLAFTKETLGIQ